MKRQLKILLVDSEPASLAALCLMLQYRQHAVFIANNGKMALDVLGTLISQSQKPDIIITEVVMPVLNGLGLANQLRMRGVCVPLIFMGNTLGTVSRADLEDHSHEFLQKPFTQQQLHDQLEALFPDRQEVPV